MNKINTRGNTCIKLIFVRCVLDLFTNVDVISYILQNFA